MMYVENSYEKFNSGGEYEVSTSALPAIAETLLYGLKHSEKPLEFSVEIINPDKNIPFEQMQEIKEWLFGQDGWKKLTLKSPEYYGYHLKCLLIPDEDITDALGYRGIRCTLKNASAYWYGEDKTITFVKEDLIELAGEKGEKLTETGNIWVELNIDSQSPCDIYPTITFKAPESYSGATGNYMNLRIYNNYQNDNESCISTGLDSKYALKDYFINTQYGLFKRNNEIFDYEPFNTSCPLLYFNKGKNEISINLKNEQGNFTPFESISFTYTPMYRIGGF